MRTFPTFREVQVFVEQVELEKNESFAKPRIWGIASVAKKVAQICNQARKRTRVEIRSDLASLEKQNLELSLRDSLHKRRY